jgi:biopolymer transport protein ExbB/TolQ
MLLEVFLAMSIATVAIAVASNLQLRAWIRITRDHDELEKVLLIKKSLYDAYQDQVQRTKKVTVQLEQPSMKITTDFEGVPKKSSLAPLKESAKIVRSVGIWKFENAARYASMILVMPRSESKQSSEKKSS